MPVCKGRRYPFRLGTTSYIYPDHILPNVLKLRETVDDIELLCFEADDESSLPDERLIAELRSIAKASNLTYTVHLPLDIYRGDCDESQRKQSIATALKVVRLTEELEPFAFNVHFEMRHADGSPVSTLKGGKTI